MIKTYYIVTSFTYKNGTIITKEEKYVEDCIGKLFNRWGEVNVYKILADENDIIIRSGQPKVNKFTIVKQVGQLNSTGNKLERANRK